MLPGQGRTPLVLCYHAVSNGWPAPLCVTPDAFRTQVVRLLERGYTPVTFTAALEASPTLPLLAITFDDAYRCVYEQAAPVLRELGTPATIFVPSSYIGIERRMSWRGIDRWIGTEYENELLPMTWPQLGELASAGWEIGSHSETHPYLTRLDDRSLRRELIASRAACEDRLGRECASIAYPYGDADERVMAEAADAGYRCGAGLSAFTGKRIPLNWPRVGIYHLDHNWRFELKVARVTRIVRESSGVGPLISAVLDRRGSAR